MRLKHVQCELAARYFREGLDGSVVDSAYIVGSTTKAIHPSMHDSLWLVAALQTEVGVGFPGDAAVVPVDLLVRGMWLNATLPPERRARYLHLRFASLLTTSDIGIERRVDPCEFWERASRSGFPLPLLQALVSEDIDTKVRLMNGRLFEGPPEVAALFTGLDERALLARNVDYARPHFGQLRERLARLLSFSAAFRTSPSSCSRRRHDTPARSEPSAVRSFGSDMTYRRLPGRSPVRQSAPSTRPRSGSSPRPPGSRAAARRPVESE